MAVQKMYAKKKLYDMSFVISIFYHMLFVPVSVV